MPRGAFVLVAVAVLAAGCADAPSGGPPSAATTPPAAPTAECPRLLVLPEPEAFPIHEGALVRVVLDNCGPDPVATDPEEGCRWPRGFSLSAHGPAGEVFLAGNGPAWTEVPAIRWCGESPTPVEVAPGANGTFYGAWDGTVRADGCIDACDVRNATAAPPGAYEIVAALPLADGSTLSGNATLTLLPARVPDAPADGPLRILLEPSYRPGERAQVRLRNDGDETYVYNPHYAACDLRYYDDEGRRFRVPPGTHCDLRSNAPVRPGETVTLFEWALDECVVDAWGCVESAPLAPGVYHVRGAFHPALGEHGADTSRSVEAGASFRIG